MRIEAILAPDAKIKILRVLFSTYSAYSVADVSIISYCSIGSVHSSIKDLAQEKIIEEIKGKGKQRYYKLSRDCPIEITNIFEKEKSYFKPVPVNVWNYLLSLTARMKKIKGVMHIALFGSYARGEQRPDSDIDLLVVSKNKIAITPDKKIKQKISILNILDKEYESMEGKKSELYIEFQRGNITLYKRENNVG